MKSRKLFIGGVLFFVFAFSLFFNFRNLSAIKVVWVDSKGYFTNKTLVTDTAGLILRNCDDNDSDAFLEGQYQNTKTGDDKVQSTMKGNLIAAIYRYYGDGTTGCGIYFPEKIVKGVKWSASSQEFNQGRNTMGARFIMTEFTGGDKKLVGKDLKAKFKKVIEDPNLYLVYDDLNDFKINSAHTHTTDNVQDVQYEKNTQNDIPSITIWYDTNNDGKGDKQVGAIKAYCGNMTDMMPANPWYIKPTIDIDKTKAKTNETVTWTYDATIDYGPISRKNPAVVTYSPVYTGKGNIGTLRTSSSSGSVSAKQEAKFSSPGQYCSTMKITYGSGWRQSDGTQIASATVYSEEKCVDVVDVEPPIGCRPITSPSLYPIVNSNYPAISYNITASSAVKVPAYNNVPYKVNSSNVPNSWGPYSTSIASLPDNFTTLNTDGERHTISRQDTTNHATSITPKYDSAYIGYWRRVKDSKTGITTPTHYDISPAVLTQKFNPSNYPADAYGWEINYQYNYLNSTVTYSDGDTSILTTGSAPTFTNETNGTSYTITSVGPCYDYTLTTSSSNVGGNYKESGSSITLNNSINSSSWTEKNNAAYYNKYKTWTKSKNIKWYLTKFVINPGVALPAAKAGGESSKAPCAYYGYKVCTTESQGTTVNPAGTGNVTYDFNIPDLKAGTKICFAFSVFTNQSDPSNDTSSLDTTPYYHSSFNPTANCLLIVKKPKVQVWSGDLSVGKALSSKQEQDYSIASSSQSVKSGLRYGSWVEYAIYATSGVTGIASGSGLSDGRTSNDCSINLLTYTNPAAANSCTGNLGGSYKYSSNMKNYTSYFSTTTPLTSTNLNEIKTSGVYSSAAKILSLTSNAAIDKSIIINAPNTDVIINNNISIATGNYTSLSQLPQVVIIAKSIKIDESVSNIDAWLLAPSGSIDTCTINGARPTALTVNSCDNQLTVNGPVVANKLYLYRTYGSDPKDESGIPAEIFNLRADAYLWMYNRSAGDNRWRSTYVTELPPRL